uniref:Lipoprotein n=1 Tax=Streptomyces sp. NBC_00093 TaxID=2975649 RepID=A0AAU2AG74_9ACTN
MVKRRSLPVAAALVASAALLLTACGGDDSESKDNDKIAGADTGSETSASPTASASAGSADRPKIELPSDLTYTFEWPKTGDKDKDAVLSDSEQFIKAVDMAIAEQDPLDKAYQFYSEGEAAAGSQKFIQEFVDYKDRITGAKRYFDAKVNVNSDGTAGLVYCEDQNKAYNKSLKTGKTNVTAASKDNYVLYSSRLRVNENGIWITETLTSQRGSSACQS